MNKAWDHHKGGRAQWVAWMSEILRECLRVLKPGGFLFIMEWDDTEASFGPEKSLRIPRETLTELLSDRGFSPVKDIAVGDYHYALVCQK